LKNIFKGYSLEEMNNFGEQGNDEPKQKEITASPDKLAKATLGYKSPEEGVSGKDSGPGGKVHGVREGTGGYKPPEDPPKGKDSTKPLDSTRYFETSDGDKSYSEIFEALAVSVAKVIEGVVAQKPEDILVTSEWLCKLHKAIAGSLFPDWAGRFRDIDVTVGTHTPPPFYEVPIHVKLFCDDLDARLKHLKIDIEPLSELFAWIDWRFEWIHPFKDFTGRVGRILLTAVSFKLKLPPIETASIEPKEKEEYLKALRLADTGDLTSLTDIWLNRLRKAVEK
jgi:fido (protein-threonine AMPylation protein)